MVFLRRASARQQRNIIKGLLNLDGQLAITDAEIGNLLYSHF